AAGRRPRGRSRAGRRRAGARGRSVGRSERRVTASRTAGERARPDEVVAVRDAVLAWYEPRRHAYPWRADDPDPYRTLVSEVMLQQTQAARVVPAYLEFVGRFPSVRRLAAARPSEVVRTWGSLGYPR